MHINHSRSLIIALLLGASVVINGHQSTIAAISGGSYHPLIYYKSDASVENIHGIPELSITNLTIDSLFPTMMVVR